MKKIALISAAAAATLALAPSAFAAPTQTLKVSLGSKIAGTTKKPVVTKMSLSTGTTLADPTKEKLDTIKYAKITLPKGIKLNYQAFAECTEEKVAPEAYTCQDSAPKSQIGTGTAKAAFTKGAYDPEGTLTPFIGSGGRLIIRTVFERPAFINQGLVGKIALKGGVYSFDFNVQEELQQILPDTFQQILDFKLNFAKKTAKKGTKTVGLIELVSCPKGGYVFKGDFEFRDLQKTSVSTTVPCKSAKK